MTLEDRHGSTNMLGDDRLLSISWVRSGSGAVSSVLFGGETSGGRPLRLRAWNDVER
jgi:hypothetical protein